jgi:hypothetical protein
MKRENHRTGVTVELNPILLLRLLLAVALVSVALMQANGAAEIQINKAASDQGAEFRQAAKVLSTNCIVRARGFTIAGYRGASSFFLETFWYGQPRLSIAQPTDGAFPVTLLGNVGQVLELRTAPTRQVRGRGSAPLP